MRGEVGERVVRERRREERGTYEFHTELLERRKLGGNT